MSDQNKADVQKVDTSDLEQHFEQWLNEPWPKGAASDRTKLWLAFKAGGDWALNEIRKNANLPAADQPDDEEALRRG